MSRLETTYYQIVAAESFRTSRPAAFRWRPADQRPQSEPARANQIISGPGLGPPTDYIHRLCLEGCEQQRGQHQQQQRAEAGRQTVAAEF